MFPSTWTLAERIASPDQRSDPVAAGQGDTTTAIIRGNRPQPVAVCDVPSGLQRRGTVTRAGRRTAVGRSPDRVAGPRRVRDLRADADRAVPMSARWGRSGRPPTRRPRVLGSGPHVGAGAVSPAARCGRWWYRSPSVEPTLRSWAASASVVSAARSEAPGRRGRVRALCRAMSPRGSVSRLGSRGPPVPVASPSGRRPCSPQRGR